MKRAIIQVEWGLLKEMLSTDSIIDVKVERGIPKDAKIIGIRNNNFTKAIDVIEIIIESDELEDIHLGSLIPEYDLRFGSRKKEYNNENSVFCRGE